MINITNKTKVLSVVLFVFVFISLNYFIIISSLKAANTAAVQATITVQDISLSVSDGTIAYGTLSVGSSKNTTSSDLNDSQTVTNSGNVATNINIKGMNSTSSGVGWTLASDPGSNTYAHKFCTTNCDVSPVWGALSIGYTELATNLATGDSTPPFDLQIYTPTTTTDFTQQTVDVTVQATL